MEITAIELPWIEAGYATFALEGPDALRVEQLARTVAISKSSFYHRFADLEVFTEFLLYWHLDRAEGMAAKAKACKTFDPDFLLLLEAHRLDLLFNRQLRVHRNNLRFQLCFQQASDRVEDEVMPIWAHALGISGQHQLARSIFAVVSDLFYQRVTKDTLNYGWMVEFLKEVDAFMKDVMRSDGIKVRS